jgi:hypothetical protein
MPKSTVETALLFILGHIFEIELIEMRESAVPAPYRKVPATDTKIMRSGNMTMPAFCRLDKCPEIITTDFRVQAHLFHILNPWNKDPGRPAIIACYLCLGRYSQDYLVCYLFAVITVGVVFCGDEPLAHERYWMSPGSLICCKKPCLSF